MSGTSTVVDQTITLGDFIDNVLCGEVGRVIEAGHHYIGFGLVAIGVEFLGACRKSENMNEYRKGLPRERFEEAINGLFPPEYSPIARTLYEHLRCGMVHVLRPKGEVRFTQKKECVGVKNAERDGKGRIVLISEQFYEDFQKACEKQKQEMAAGEHHHKLSDPFLVVREESQDSGTTTETSGCL